MREIETRRTSERGFTLTEILVAVAIFAIIFIAALMIYDRSNQVFRRSMEQSDMQQNTRVAFEGMVAELRMAGFDFDRDGTPTGDSVYQSPDEQLEYIGPSAITFRSNLDYEIDAANDNGREPDYEPGSATPSNPDDDYIPLVTTANDEIVTYALVSQNAAANSDSITFYADVARPRRTYPDTGGQSETQVTISDVDLCDDGDGCVNPPYTLYRFTLDDSGNVVRSPVADNIRSMYITYFSDGLGLTPVTPNGGAGQYTVSSTGVTTTAAAFQERAVRGSVQSLAIEIIGMTEQPDKNWNDPIEDALPAGSKVAAASQHRQYQLSTNVVPRNLGRRGMQEPSTTPPGAPEVTAACAEGCGVVRVEWDAPSYGTVDGYSIIYDTTGGSGAFGSTPVSAGTNLFGYVSGLDPNQQYWFKVVASNSFGSERSINSEGPVYPINYTKPAAPTLTGATGDGTNPALENDITLAWTISETNDPSFDTDSCGNSYDVGSINEVKLNSGFEIYRSETDWAGADPVASELIWDGLVSDIDGPTVLDNYTATWTDTTPKVACKTYYYKIRQKETCYANPAHNVGSDVTVSLSDFSNQISGEATATVAPSAPAAPVFNSALCIPAPTSKCAFQMQWNPVTTDVNGNPIAVETYTIHRFNATGAVEDPTSEVTVNVVDADPTDGPVIYSFSTPEPPSGSLYHFYVSATSCTTLQSGLSSPALKYPCSTMTSSGPSPAPIDGSGTSVGSPFLINSPSASVDLTLSGVIADARVTIYVGNTATVVDDSVSNPTLVSYVPNVSTTASFNIPLSSSQVYRAEMTLTDTNSCSNTLVYWFTESVTGCCLVPFRDSTGSVFDASLITMSPSGTGGGADTTVTYTFRNQCSQPLTLNQFKLTWNSSNGALGVLKALNFPDGTSPSLPFPVGSGTAVVVPTAATNKTIPANGSYTVKMLFDRNSTDRSHISGMCAEYSDGAAAPVECSIYQAGSFCTVP